MDDVRVVELPHTPQLLLDLRYYLSDHPRKKESRNE